MKKVTFLKTYRKMLPAAISLILAVGMVAAAELLNDKEIIFPEITAVTIGALTAPRQPWNTSRLRLLLTITAAAVAGVGISLLVPLPLVLKVPLAMICSISLVTLSKTEFLPAISACVLPVLLGTKSPVYICSVAVMTSLILLAQLLLERCGIREPNSFSPTAPDRKLLALRIKQITAAGLICILPALTHEIFFIAPPLIVAFFEMSKPGSKLLERSPQAVMLIMLAAVSGVLSRFVLTMSLGLPLAVAAAVSCAVILFAVSSAGFYFPPCGAIATLPFIIPEETLFRFPFEIAAGTLVFLCAAYGISRERRIISGFKKILRPQN